MKAKKSQSVPPPSEVGQKAQVGAASDSRARRFVLDRTEDVSGNSGTGVVAEGVRFSNGQAVVHFISQLESITVYANMTVVNMLHGHDGRTKVRWLDK